MHNHQNEITRNDNSREDGKFYMALGWLAALSVSISAALVLN